MHFNFHAKFFFSLTLTIFASIVLATEVFFRVNETMLKFIGVFLGYHLIWLLIPVFWRRFGISFQWLQIVSAAGPIMWATFPIILLQRDFSFAFYLQVFDIRLSIIKAIFKNPDLVSDAQWLFLSLDGLALLLFAFAVRPFVRGHSIHLLRQHKSSGSGQSDTTARLADARWANKSEIKENFSVEGGIVLGEMTNPISQSTNFNPSRSNSWGRQGKSQLLTISPSIGNGHTLVISEPNGYKTSGIVIPNILHYDGPILVLDPKGDLYARTAQARRNKGFNPLVISQVDGIDPLSILKPLMQTHPSVFYHLAENLIPEGPHATENSQYFRERALDLLSGLLFHFVAEDEPNVLKSISELLSMPMDELIKKAVNLGDKSKYPFVRNPLLRLRAVDSKGFESLVRSISNKFKFAEFPDVRGYIEEIDDRRKYEQVLDPKTDVYINVPSRVLKSFSPMVHLLLASILTATQIIEQPERPSARRLLILDEAKGLGSMDVLELIRDEGRAVGLHLMMIYQSWGQMKKIWGPDAAAAWEDSVDARIIGATQDANKAAALQNIIGKDTLRYSTNSRSRSYRDLEVKGQSQNSEAEQLKEVPLITTAEIANFPPHGAIILSRRCKPVLGSKAIYFARNDMKDRVEAFEDIVDVIDIPKLV